MKKLPFETVSLQVDLLYSKELGRNESVYDRIELVVAYLESVGWTEEEFESQMLYGIVN